MFDVLLPPPTLSTIAVALAVPLLLLVARQKPGRRFFLLQAGMLLLFLMYMMQAPEALGHETRPVRLLGILPGIDISFGLDALSLAPCLSMALVAFLGSLYLSANLKESGCEKGRRTTVLYACVTMAALGLCQAASIASLLLMSELMIVFLYPLVDGEGPEEQEQGRKTLFIYLYMSSRLCLLPAAILTYLACGTLDLPLGNVPSGMFPATTDPFLMTLVFILYVAGFALSGLAPFHGWLVAVASSSRPVASFLAMPMAATAGAFALCRVMVAVFGAQDMARLHLSMPMAWLGAATIILGALAALGRLNVKVILTYCMISQLGHSVVGAAIMNRDGLMGGMANLVLCSLAGATCFMVAGAVQNSFGREGLMTMRGLGRRMPWSFGALTAAGLSLVGLPPSAGFVGKNILYMGVSATGSIGLSLTLLVGTLLVGSCMLRIFCTVFFQPAAGMVRLSEYREASTGLLVPMCLTAAVAIILGCFPEVLMTVIRV